jgi:hypothetical protein
MDPATHAQRHPSLVERNVKMLYINKLIGFSP